MTTATPPAPQPPAPLRLAVLISGGGRTLLNLADAIDRGELPATIHLVISSRADVSGIAKSIALGFPTHLVPRRDHASPASFSAAIWDLVRAQPIDLVVLAGFLSLITVPPDFRKRVINIHPALLPKYGGKGMYGHHVHEAVLAARDTESGCTVHYVDDQYDHGDPILQLRCPVLPGDTPDTLAARVFQQECLAFPQALRLLASQPRR
jgi:phosphoribosylglycinamide formyltransferase-1